MLKLIKMVIEKIFRSKPLRKPSPQRSKPLSTSFLGYEKWILAVPGAINCPSRWTNVLRRRFLIRIFLDLKSLEPSLFNALKIPRPLTGLKKTIRIISRIEKAVVIVTLTNPDFKAPIQLLELTQRIFQLRTVVIGYLKRMTMIWANSLVTIITNRDILLTRAPSLTSQKTSISFDNFYVGDWHW